jgi:hypothetical protein
MLMCVPLCVWQLALEEGEEGGDASVASTASTNRIRLINKRTGEVKDFIFHSSPINCTCHERFVGPEGIMV